MSLPNLPQKDNYRREVRTEWGGINLNENAGDGELIEAMNMSSREYPLLATARFAKAQSEYAMQAPYVYDGELGFEYSDTGAYGTGIYLHDPTRPTAIILVDGLEIISGVPKYTKQYAIMGTRLCMFGEDYYGHNHHKRIYDFSTGAGPGDGDGIVPDMEATFDSGEEVVVFRDGTLGGVPAAGNTIYCSGVDWSEYFSVGDGVAISGSGLPENNKTATIREIDGDYLRFSENCFTVESYWHLYLEESLSAGSYYFYTDSSTWYGFTLTGSLPAGVMLELKSNSIEYQVPGSAPVTLATYTGGTPSGTELVFLPPADADHVTLARTVPDLDFVCVNENRLWGCKGDTIYCSKQGDPLNWNVFDGISTDSWTTETGTPGDFTGCCSYQGYPTFFKENAVFKVLGDEPKNFTLRKQNIMGVKKGADKTVVEIRGMLYYLSHAGVMEWNGGDYPTIISNSLGIDPGLVSNAGSAGAGTDTVRYYIELRPFRYTGNEYIPWEELFGVYVYDTRYGTWHRLQNELPFIVNFAGDGVHNWMLKDYYEVYNELIGRYEYRPTIYNFSSVTDLADTETNWTVTFADSTRAYKTALTGSESKKGVLRLLIRCRLAGSMKVWIAYDGGEFEEAAEFGGDDGLPKTSRVVPLILRRCDFWQLRLTGTGDAVIYSIAVEKYGGEWQQA